jgi:hypothetical protein
LLVFKAYLTNKERKNKELRLTKKSD